jgi:DNA invertase Pin-like site-specific DNA recombinase
MIFTPSNPNELAEILKQAIPTHGRDIDHTKLRYVIYARKSTDEDGKQVHSIEDQVAVCLEFANKNDINIRREDILMEKMSAKESGARSVFLEMLRKFRVGDYDGIIAWHPDRLSRNMKEAGEVIDMLDKNIIKDLKFPSFSFINDTSGKMLLGITFVLSKEYSDKLSDDVSRGNEKSIERGSYVNKAKHGYHKDRNSNLVPASNNFILMQRAFQLRLEGKTLDEISEYLTKNEYYHANTETSKKVYGMTKQKLQTIMKDPVYTGILKYGKNVVVNLIEIQGFIPMITVPEFMRINKLHDDADFIKLSKRYRKGEDVKANLMRGMIICGECEEELTAGITTKAQKNGSGGYFYYRCDTEGCSQKNKGVRANKVIKFATDYLNAKPFSSKESYEHFVMEMKKVLAENASILRGNILTNGKQLLALQDKLERTKDLLIGDEEDTVKDFYRKDLAKIELEIKAKEKDEKKYKKMLVEGKDAIITYEEFIELMEKVPQNIPKMTQMKDLDYILSKIFLNFFVLNKKPYKLTLNTPFDMLENQNVLMGAQDWT